MDLAPSRQLFATRSTRGAQLRASRTGSGDFDTRLGCPGAAELANLQELQDPTHSCSAASISAAPHVERRARAHVSPMSMCVAFSTYGVELHLTHRSFFGRS